MSKCLRDKCLEDREAILTIFDNLHMTARVHSALLGEWRKPSPWPFELHVVRQSRTLRRRYRAQNGEIECWANYIEEPDNPVRRVILFTEGRQLEARSEATGSQLRPEAEEEVLTQELPPESLEENVSQEVPWE